MNFRSKATPEATTVSAHMEVGQRLPTVAAHRVGGGEIILPDDVEGEWAAILFYRGNWCPYCRSQLRDFQHSLARFESSDIGVVALSSDPISEAQATVEGHGIRFPVGYGLDALRIREILGSYVDEERGFIQATGFVLRPGGLVELAVYSSGAIGRLVASDVLGFIEYARQA